MSVARALINMTLTVPFAVWLSSCGAPGEPGVAPPGATSLDEDLQYFSGTARRRIRQFRTSGRER